MSAFNPNDLITKLNFNELAMLATACQERMAHLQAEGVKKLAQQFEQQSLEQLGLSAKAVLATLGKKRGRPSTKLKLVEEAPAADAQAVEQ